MNEALFSSNRHDWETPQWLFDELNAEFNFELDAAANADNAKCDIYYTEETDGLTSDWYPYVTWINPPYGIGLYKWVEKAHKESLKGGTVVMLMPARTDTRYFHDFIWDRQKHKPRQNVEVRFLKGRIKFVGASNSAPFPSMIVIWNGRKLED